MIGWAGRMMAMAFRAFPRPFRERNQADALAYFEDRMRERMAEQGRPGALAFVLISVGETVVAGLAERARGWVGLGAATLDDIGQAVRGLRRDPGFVVSAAVPVALGVAGVTAVFAVFQGVVLKPLPYPAAERLVKVGRPLDNGVLAGVSNANLLDVEGTVDGLEALGGVQGGSTLLRASDEAILLSVSRPTRGFMGLFDLAPALGRSFTPEDFVEPDVALVSWELYRTRLGGRPDVLGTTLDTELGALRVVGVLPPDWVPPVEALPGSAGDLWVPLDYTDPTLERTRAFGFSDGAALLAPGASLERVNEELRARALALAERHPEANRLSDGRPRLLEARSLHEETVGDMEGRIALVFGAVVLLLLVACANVANLFLARGRDRQRELAVRTVLGAGRRRLVVQLLAESLAVALAGGVVGCVLAWLSVDALVAATPDLPRADAVAMDGRVLLAALGVSVLSGAVFGLLPAVGASAAEPGRALRESGRAATSGERLRSALVVGQVALAMVMVCSGGLLVHSLVELARVDVGFRTDGVAFFRTRQPIRTDGEDAAAYTRRLAEAVAAIPGVESVSGSMFIPGGGRPANLRVVHPETGEVVQRLRHSVLPGFFRTLDIPLLEGRDLEGVVSPEQPRAAVVSRRLAEEFWPGRSPLGETLRMDGDTRALSWTVVGVVDDIRTAGPQDPPDALFYDSWYQDPWLPSMGLLLRHRGDGAALMPALRDAARSVDPGRPVTEAGTLADRVRSHGRDQRGYATLLGLFSALALGIAAVGVYAVMTHAVSARLRELSIRRAVGADAADVAGLVLRRGLALAGSGLAAGTGLALVATRGLDDLLFGVGAADPLTYALVGAVLLAAALGACLAPMRRAMRVDPMEVLRSE